jgi:hypothetical protein
MRVLETPLYFAAGIFSLLFLVSFMGRVEAPLARWSEPLPSLLIPALFSLYGEESSSFLKCISLLCVLSAILISIESTRSLLILPVLLNSWTLPSLLSNCVESFLLLVFAISHRYPLDMIVPILPAFSYNCYGALLSLAVKRRSFWCIAFSLLVTFSLHVLKGPEYKQEQIIPGERVYIWGNGRFLASRSGPNVYPEGKRGSGNNAVYLSATSGGTAWRFMVEDVNPQPAAIPEGATVYIEHVQSSLALFTIDAASPLTMSRQEVTCAGKDRGSLFTLHYRKNGVFLRHVETGAYVTRGRKREVNGVVGRNKSHGPVSGLWRVVKNTGGRSRTKDALEEMIHSHAKWLHLSNESLLALVLSLLPTVLGMHKAVPLAISMGSPRGRLFPLALCAARFLRRKKRV